MTYMGERQTPNSSSSEIPACSIFQNATLWTLKKRAAPPPPPSETIILLWAVCMLLFPSASLPGAQVRVAYHILQGEKHVIMIRMIIHCPRFPPSFTVSFGMKNPLPLPAGGCNIIQSPWHWHMKYIPRLTLMNNGSCLVKNSSEVCFRVGFCCSATKQTATLWLAVKTRDAPIPLLVWENQAKTIHMEMM